MKLAYHAFDKTGREVSDRVEAASADEARERLRREGLFVTDISEAEGVPAGSGKSGGRGWKTRRLKDLAMFTRQLYVLVSSGTQLAEALRALERQARGAGWRGVIVDVRTRLEKGAGLADAMDSHPEYFDSVYRSMVAAGESGGDFPQMLDRLARLAHKRVRIRSSVVGAMIYPGLLMTVAGGVLTVMLLFVIPRFAELFASLDVPLPPSTAALISLSHALRSYWWALLLGAGAVAAAVMAYLKTAGGKRLADTVVLRLPRIGGIVRSFATARISRLLGILITSHLPVLEALRLARSAVPNVHYVELMARAEEAVIRGEPISSAFRGSDLISPSVYEATRSGENSGQVGPLLLNISDFLDEENEVVLKGLTSILEPGVLVLLGVLVGFVALSMFMPLFDVTAMTGGAR